MLSLFQSKMTQCQFYKKIFYFLLSLFAIHIYWSSAEAKILGLELSRSPSVALGYMGVLPVGNHGQTFGFSSGGKAELWIPTNWWAEYLDLNFSFSYMALQPLNELPITVHSMAPLVGVRLHSRNLTRDNREMPFQIFMGLDLGGAVMLLQFVNAQSAVLDAGIYFMAQLTFGIDVPVIDKFGVVLQNNTQFIFSQFPLTLWNPVVSARYSF